jgi:RimJ/RimL family protein N-acetyltransferase
MIEGTVINLRAMEMDDLERNVRWMNDPEVTRYIIMRYPLTRAAEEAWMRERTGKFIDYSDVMLAIETKDGRHIGNCGLHHGAIEDRRADLGIAIGEQDCWGKGYGTDAVRTLLRFGFEEMNLHRISLDVYDFNERARASYRKAGFVEEALKRQDQYKDGRYLDVITMAILRPEWEQRRD